MPPSVSTTSPTDGQLLAAFAQRRDGAAFAQLVERHGSMVREACRAMLKAEAAVGADDAAQAVFVALALKAPSLLNHPTLAGWLHRAARCVCAEVRRSEARRHLREQEAARMRAMSSSQAVDPSEIHNALDALPEKYRVPLILHHMEGLTEQQTADRLGLGLSATSSRLERGREKLRARLTRTGAVVSVAGVGLMLAPASSAASTAFVAAATESALAAVGPTAALTASTPVLALAKGAIHMLFMAKMKLAALMTAAVMLVGGAGAGVALWQVRAEDGPRAERQAAFLIQAQLVEGVDKQPANAPEAWVVEAVKALPVAREAGHRPPAHVAVMTNWLPLSLDRATEIRGDGLKVTATVRQQPGGVRVWLESEAGNARDGGGWFDLRDGPGGGPRTVRKITSGLFGGTYLAVQVVYPLATQPASQPAHASAPVVKGGLELTVAPANAVFPPGEVRLVVALRNTSDKIIRLYEQKQQWARPELHVLIRDRKGPKSYSMILNRPAKGVIWVLRSLKPGESIPLELASDRVIGEDRPGGKGVPKVGPLPAGDYEVTVELRLVDFATIREAVAQYAAEARAAAALGRDAVAVPALPEQADVWSGQITSAPARFSVADPAAATQAADGGIAQDKAEAIALEAVLAYFKDDPIRQKALRVSVPMKKVEEGGKTYWLVQYFGSNGKAKIATWTEVRVDAQTGTATVRPTPGKFGA